ncbi:hypothetical protein Ancab_034075 [Ancistrocladus abbreviatus]
MGIKADRTTFSLALAERRMCPRISFAYTTSIRHLSMGIEAHTCLAVMDLLKFRVSIHLQQVHGCITGQNLLWKVDICAAYSQENKLTAKGDLPSNSAVQTSIVLYICNLSITSLTSDI